MIGYLKGTLVDKDEKTLLVLVDKVGFTVYVPEKEISFIKEGSEIELFTELVVRENEMHLYGFLTKEEKEMFNILNEVSGIGPRSSIGIISFLDINTLSKAVVNEDINTLIKLPGIGKKTAQRIILDIKEKLVKRGNFGSQKITENKYSAQEKDKLSIVFDSLEALGYSNKEILHILPELENNRELSEQEIIKSALKILSGR